MTRGHTQQLINYCCSIPDHEDDDATSTEEHGGTAAADLDNSSTHLDCAKELEEVSSCGTSGDGGSSSQDALQRSSAVFLLVLKEKYKLTQRSVMNVIQGVTNLFQLSLPALQTKIITRNRGHVTVIRFTSHIQGKIRVVMPMMATRTRR